MCTGLSYNLEGTSHFVRKFFRWTSYMEELSADVGLRSYRKIGSRQTVSVSVSVPLLILLRSSHVLLQHAMKSVKIEGKFSSTGRGHFLLRVNSDVWVVTFVSEERHNAGRRVRSVIVHEFRERQKRQPVILLVVTVYANVLLKGLVGTLCLSIGFRMITGSEMEAHV